MVSNNIPQDGSATKPAPSPGAMAGKPPKLHARLGKPPKLYTRLRMASLTAPQVIGETRKRDYAPAFFGTRQRLGWVIGFLIAGVVALSVVIRLVQADVKNEKNFNMAVVEQRGKLKDFMGDVEKEKAVLKTRVAELEQKWQISAQLQAELANARKLNTEAETRLQQATVAKAAAEQNMATLKARLDDVSQKVATVQEQAKQVQALQDEIGRENQRQTELANARKLSAEAETRLQQATVAKTAAEQDIAMLKARLNDVSQKVVTVQEQAKQVQAMRDEIGRENQRQAELSRARKFSTEADLQAAKKKRTDSQAHAAKTPTVERFSLDRGETPSAAIESAQAADQAKAAGVFLSAGSEANQHFKAGFQKWDEDNVDGSMAEFKKTISLDSSAAAAYYNIALGYIEKGDRYKACDYLYQAGEIYLKNKDNKQAVRVAELMRTIAPYSSLTEKFHRKIVKK